MQIFLLNNNGDDLDSLYNQLTVLPALHNCNMDCVLILYLSALTGGNLGTCEHNLTFIINVLHNKTGILEVFREHRYVNVTSC